MSTKNAGYIAVSVELHILCHACKEKLVSPRSTITWNREDVSTRYFSEIQCGVCDAVNKLPSKIQNVFSG